MRPSQAIIVIPLCLLLSTMSSGTDKKKHMLVRAGQAAQQVNNHPWSYTSPGRANTNCSGDGTVSGTATDSGYGTTNVTGTANTNSNCSTTYTPPQTVSGNRTTVDNASWVTDTATGDEYLVECTANWVGSKCSYLTGGTYKAELEGNNMWITGMKGMKEVRAKYRVLRFVNWAGAVPSPGSLQHQSFWTPDEAYAWETYQNLTPEDKDFVRVYCGANLKGAALVPRAQAITEQSAQHSLDCVAWASAKQKAE